MTINSKFPFEILWPLRNYHIVYLKNNIKPCGEKLEVLQLKCASKKVALFKESIVASKHFLDEILAVDVNSLFPETTAHMPNHTAWVVWI